MALELILPPLTGCVIREFLSREISWVELTPKAVDDLAPKWVRGLFWPLMPMILACFGAAARCLWILRVVGFTGNVPKFYYLCDACVGPTAVFLTYFCPIIGVARFPNDDADTIIILRFLLTTSSSSFDEACFASICEPFCAGVFFTAVLCPNSGDYCYKFLPVFYK